MLARSPAILIIKKKEKEKKHLVISWLLKSDAPNSFSSFL